MTNVIPLPTSTRDHRRSVAEIASDLGRAADMQAVDRLRVPLADWLDQHEMNSPTALMVLLTVLLGECVVAAGTASREGCGEPGCEACSAPASEALSPRDVAAAVLLVARHLAEVSLPESVDTVTGGERLH